MRFPFRLSAGLLKAKISGLSGGPASGVPIFRFNLCPAHPGKRERFEQASAELSWHSPEECAAQVRRNSSPVVWIGDTEPLLHPEIGRAANAMVETGRFVFIHTSGYSLRNRIHEFRPDSRLFLTLEFAGREEVHNRAVGRPDAFQRSIEAIRAAKLSGFHIAAHITVTSETNSCDAGELIEYLDKMDVDGFVVTTTSHAAGDSSLARTLADVRAMIRSGRWETFSKLLEASCAEASPARERNKYSTGARNAFEEGD
jgi:MoaA/NifB/PqqE/SkfB family radical SAM enzyme